MTTIRALSTMLAGCGLLLAGCTSLLGDFSYDPNAGSGGSAGKSNIDQGDIELLPPNGLVTTEQGAKATFTIALKRQPTANVAIALSSSNENEGKVSPISVSFTPDNYNAPQVVQVTGVDDELEDKSQVYTIRTSPASSDDATFNGLNPIDPEVTNVDDETAGFLVTPTTGLITSESGTEAMFSIVLNHAPTADVVVGLSVDKPGEATVSSESLVFTELNWMAPQVVTVTGVNDDAADGAQPFKVVTAAAVSADAAYDKLDPQDVELLNQDNDTAGVTLTPQLGLVTFESGAMTTFGIALNSPPSKDVTIALSSSNEAEGIVTPAAVTFTDLNWMAPQVITITGVNDDRVDGNQPYLIVTSEAQSEDAGYGGLEVPDAEVINIDNDTPGLTVTPTVAVTSETGEAATFSVNLNSKPAGQVLLDVSSSRPEEGVVSPATLVFTEQNWEAPQVVTVTGVDDEIADGMQTYTVHVTPNAASEDPGYAALLESDVSLSNTDDDSAGITLMAQPGLTTSELGGSATFTLVLNSQPTADVRIGLTSNDTSEGTVTPAQLVFTPENYNAPQVVTIKGVDDPRADGNQPYRIITEPAVSDDPGYSAMNAPNLEVTNIDDDSPGIVVVPSANETLVTTEGGGTATFTVVLTSEPIADVNIAVASSNVQEGTVSTSNLRFTASNWAAPQTVTVRGVNDDVDDGGQIYRVSLSAATSDDLNYRGRDPLDVTVRNTDNDSAGITLTPTTGLTTSEAGGEATFQIVLNSKPTASVSIGLSSSRTAEGTVSPATVSFTTTNWAAPQTVTITGVDDDVADGGQVYRIVTTAATSADPEYSGWDPPDPTVSNTDNDSAGVTVTPTVGLTTTEAGATATFSIVLNSQPTADVVIPLRSSKPAEGTPSPSSVTFTSANWSAPRIITLTGVNDDAADGAQPYTIFTDPAMSSDAKYDTWDPPDVTASNTDNDSAGITVSAVSGNTSEMGGTASFTVVLNSEPYAAVGIAVSSSATREGTVSPSTLTFTAQNWSAPQKVTVAGVDDAIADGSQPYSVVIAAATSGDPAYNELDARDVDLNNVDDDSAGVTVSEARGNTREDGTSTTFTIVLNSEPTADVTIPLSSSNGNEGTIAISAVSFTSDDWSSPKTVTVTGVDDDVADGNQPYSIVLGVATSDDEGYAGLNATDVDLTNVDNDSAGISVNATMGETDESGDTMTFKVVLDSKPKASVSIPVSSSDTDEGTVSPSSLTFTTDNWNSAQTVTVTGVNDDFFDGAQPYTVLLGITNSSDAAYDELNPPDVSMSNVDNDSAGIDISPAAGSTSESGTNTTFTIVLNSQPTANVTIPLSSNDSTEGTLSVTSVTFTTNDWDEAKTVTVRGENDDVVDGDRPYKIITAAATSDDENYGGMNADDVDVVNLDNDSAGVIVDVVTDATGEDGTTASFTVRLSSEPMATVSIPIQSSDTTEGTLSVDTVDFTTSNWSDPQTITVTGVDDDVADGDQDYEITLGTPASSDVKYTALDPDDVALTNVDDDSAAVVVEQPTAKETGEATGAPEVSFVVRLTSAPSASVSIDLVSSAPSEGIISSPASGRLTFNDSNWTGQTVTVTGVDDADADGNAMYSISLELAESDDEAYDGLNPADVTGLVNIDDEPPPEEPIE
jgi:hypothetical protein